MPTEGNEAGGASLGGRGCVLLIGPARKQGALKRGKRPEVDVKMYRQGSGAMWIGVRRHTMFGV